MSNKNGTEVANQDYSERHLALAKHMDEVPDAIRDTSGLEFYFGHQEYLVLSDVEAYEKAHEVILDSIWTLRASFLAQHSSVLREKEILALKNRLADGANGVLLRSIEDISDLVDDAIQTYGRGHFLAKYDGEEGKEGEFYIYRLA